MMKLCGNLDKEGWFDDIKAIKITRWTNQEKKNRKSKNRGFIS